MQIKINAEQVESIEQVESGELMLLFKPEENGAHSCLYINMNCTVQIVPGKEVNVQNEKQQDEGASILVSY